MEWFCLVVLLCSGMGTVKSEFLKDFMLESCGETLTRTSGRLETSLSLTYDDNMDCRVSISVTQGKKILLFFKRFEVERYFSGSCLDYLNVYDGNSVAGSLLNDNPMCGEIFDVFNFTTSSNHVTLKFVSDDSAVYRGFEIEYTEFTYAPCDDTEFQCDNMLCIPSDNECDDVTQCGDYSDEAICTLEEILASETQDADLAVIIGSSIAGLLVLIIIIVVIIKLYQYYKWKRFLRRNKELSIDDLYQYPVTDLYNKHDIGEKGRRNPDVKPYYDNIQVLTPGDEDGKYIQEM